MLSAQAGIVSCMGNVTGNQQHVERVTRKAAMQSSAEWMLPDCD
jgi:phosphoribosylformylglycinamidine (FGAM) synthase-like amidotransferase family enzyme